MKESFRQSMAWLHTWAGLVVGWVLFFVFVTGTVGYFYLEINRWMRPELPISIGIPSSSEFAIAAEGYLRRHAANAGTWQIDFPNDRQPQGRIEWRNTLTDANKRLSRHRKIFDYGSGTFVEPTPVRATGGGFLLYRMHGHLYYVDQLTGRLIVGFCSMIMFIAIITGVITHKKIVANFFTFRPGTKQHNWLDVHNIAAVLALPFFVMITFSGLVLFMHLYLPSSIYAAYVDAGDYQKFRYGERETVERSGLVTPTLRFEYFLSKAERHWGEGTVRRFIVLYPGDANSLIKIHHNGRKTIRRSELNEFLYVSAINGEVVRHISGRETARRSPPPSAAQEWCACRAR